MTNTYNQFNCPQVIGNNNFFRVIYATRDESNGFRQNINNESFFSRQVPQPIVLNSVCAAPCDGGWYRCQIVSYDEDTDTCDVKYLDYGGYASVAASSLKQIRTDFLSLPFQAIECYLANIQPQDDENVSALVLEELVSGQVVQARMIGTNEQGIPMVHLYR